MPRRDGTSAVKDQSISEFDRTGKEVLAEDKFSEGSYGLIGDRHGRGLALFVVLIAACSIAAFSQDGIKPSFDCSKARKTAEVLVCKNGELSALDGAMAGLYSQVRRLSSNPSQLTLDQRAWIVRRDACQSIECLHNAYESRILDLKNLKWDLSGPTTTNFTALIGKPFIARCGSGECSWFTIESIEPAGQSPRGQLFKFTRKDWSSDHPGGDYDRPAPLHPSGEATTEFVFCSKTMPVLIEKNEPDRGSGWSATMLAPDNSSTISNPNVGVNNLYWAACHGRPVDSQDDFAARKAVELGYHVNVPPDGLEGKELQQPTDALKW